MNGILNESIVVKEYDSNKPYVHEIDYFLNDIIEDCRNKHFHTFENRLVYDFKFTNISNNEEINFTITHRTMELYGLNKKIKTARRNGFLFIQKIKTKDKIL